LRTEKLKGKKHKFSLFSLSENRENNVIFPFSLFGNREEKNVIYVIFHPVNIWQEIGKIGKKKTGITLFSSEGKSGRKKHTLKGMEISFPAPAGHGGK
jgi:hypothetical protein